VKYSNETKSVNKEKYNTEKPKENQVGYLFQEDMPFIDRLMHTYL
jgi:hypothetical protein